MATRASALSLLLLLAPSFAAAAADLTGEWTLKLFQFGDSIPARVQLKADGKQITGTLNELKLTGTSSGETFTIKAVRPNGEPWGEFTGRMQNENQLAGSAKRGTDEMTWEAKRVPPPSANTAPKTHTFVPTKYQRQFSGAIEPVLHVNPGDTIQTTTVDAGGFDHKGVRRSMGGNPETGPFYIEGAMPGDTLTVKFRRIHLNRDTAVSGDRIVGSALSPYYYRDAKFDDKFDSDWALDRQGGTASLAKPTERLKNYKVKLAPMLGCVGVAPPANQAYRSGWLGSWGGNMDYHGLREGVTVSLPVYQEGALLFVGDGHAAQGDGELNGDALETSMDVEFTVDLVRGKNIGGPRFENEEFVMASGIAGSLPDALQQATTELSRWLEKDFHLSANEAHVVLGTAIQYEIAEVVDPQVHIVAKISKEALAQLQ